MIDVIQLKSLVDFMCKYYDKSKLTNKEKNFLIKEFLKSDYITLDKLHAITLDMNNLDKDMEPEVHANHCCVIHGCKYGDEDCPVVLGKVKQEYKCEFCCDSNDELKYVIKDLESSDE